MKKFEYFDVTADIGLKAYGESLDEAFERCQRHCAQYEAFVTCGARDPGLPVLAKRLVES